jgi:hypothetical protein
MTLPELLDLLEAEGIELSLCLTLTMTRRVNTGKRQPLAAYRFGGLECMLLGPGEGGLMSMIG